MMKHVLTSLVASMLLLLLTPSARSTVGSTRHGLPPRSNVPLKPASAVRKEYPAIQSLATCGTSASPNSKQHLVNQSDRSQTFFVLRASLGRSLRFLRRRV